MNKNNYRYYSAGKIKTWIDKHCKRCGRFIETTQHYYCKICRYKVKKENHFKSRKITNWEKVMILTTLSRNDINSLFKSSPSHGDLLND